MKSFLEDICFQHISTANTVILSQKDEECRTLVIENINDVSPEVDAGGW